MPRCSRSLRSQQHRERPYKGKRSQRCIFWAGFTDELYRCLAMEDFAVAFTKASEAAVFIAR